MLTVGVFVLWLFGTFTFMSKFGKMYIDYFLAYFKNKLIKHGNKKCSGKEEVGSVFRH